MKRSRSFYILLWMILLSLSLGVFISYFFVFVNSLFISEIGTSQLPMAYIFSGLGGTLITWLFNVSEKKIGFAKASTFFCLVFALVMYILWYLFIQGNHLYLLIFFSYAWFWVCINFTALVFWKLPSNLFDLSENKKYNGVISTGEVISAIVAYLSVPALLNLESFTRDKLLLISFFGIAAFSIITYFLGRSVIKPDLQKNPNKPLPSSSRSLIKESYFQLIFLSVFLAVIIQLLIDFSLMEISANQMSDAKELAKYFAFLFGGMRLLELILKTFVSKYLVREYGVFISLSSLIFSLALIAIIGISSLAFGYIGIILIVASLSKVFERSLYRSVYAPTINILYQAYPTSKRALTQNYADGFGKTIGQIIAALLIFAIATVDSFESRVFILLMAVLIILAIWFIISKKLIVHYKIELSSILKSFQNRKDLAVQTSHSIPGSLSPKSENTEKPNLSYDRIQLTVGEQIKSIIRLLAMESNPLPASSNSRDQEAPAVEMLEITHSAISNIQAYETNELLYLLNHISALKIEGISDSKLMPLFILLIEVSIFKKTKNFNFYHSNKKLRSTDFLTSALIQNLVDGHIRHLNNEDYFYLLEERIQKYTYLLASLRDLTNSNPALYKLILSEAKATQFDILYALNFRHDPMILKQIVQMLNQGEKSQELIAMELLELVLEEQEKKWILPILKEEQPENILSKLEAEFPQAVLGKEKRLVSILANTLTDMPSLIKSQALIELITSHADKNYHQLATTLSKNSKGLIQFTATKLNQSSGVLPMDNLSDHPKYFANLLTSELNHYLESETTTTISYFYWANEMCADPLEIKIQPVYSTIYQSVFPLERFSKKNLTTTLQ